MNFELIDSKKNCDSVFVEGKITSFPSINDAVYTWDYSSLLEDKQYELACLYAGTKNIEDAVSPELRERYSSAKIRLKAFMKSFRTAHISLDENCFFDLVPLSFVIEFFSLRSEMIRYIFDNYERPENYDFMYDLNKLLYEISDREVKINIMNLNNPIAHKALEKSKKVKYTQFNAITGRLSTEKDSFQILRLPKDERCIVEPTNDFLLEIDFNAFEPRVILGLNGVKQPKIDLHEWNRENLFLGMLSRDDTKKKFLAWMYDESGRNILTPNQQKKAINFYNKQAIKNKHYDGKTVTNFYGRKILADQEHAFNYIVQSTGSDLFLRQAIKVDKLLSGKKSFVKFLVHDCLVLDMSLEEKDIINDIFETFSMTDFGRFKISKKVGKNYGNMRDL